MPLESGVCVNHLLETVACSCPAAQLPASKPASPPDSVLERLELFRRVERPCSSRHLGLQLALPLLQEALDAKQGVILRLGSLLQAGRWPGGAGDGRYAAAGRTLLG